MQGRVLLTLIGLMPIEASLTMDQESLRRPVQLGWLWVLLKAEIITGVSNL